MDLDCDMRLERQERNKKWVGLGDESGRGSGERIVTAEKRVVLGYP